MAGSGRVLVYIACSLDGFIAGPGDDLSWLPGATGEPAGGEYVGPPRDPETIGYEEFIAGVGALLMGRRTHDVIVGFGGEWPYGHRPVLVTTNRPLEPGGPTVRAVSGEIGELVAAARAAADGRDVYLDGGDLIRQALDAGLVDELIVTFVPVVLGSGHPLFAGITQRRSFELLAHTSHGQGMVQLHLRPARTAAGA